ncbi:hypothetical protein A0K93_09085 [Corynebacterium sp. BCW_4722]|nr:hypothetical protein A0K93_09085 [Corynebacterium sp. BCW_4722]
MKLIHCACGSGVSIPGVEEHLLIDEPPQRDLKFLDAAARAALPVDPTPSLDEIQRMPDVAHMGAPDFAPQQPEEPLRVIVSGTDRALGLVLTRLMRADNMWVEVAYVPVDPSSPAALIWGAESVSLAMSGEVRPIPCVRTDFGEVVAGSAELTHAGGGEYVGEVIVDSETLLYSSGRGARLVPLVDAPGMAAAALVKRPFRKVAVDDSRVLTGRAVQSGGEDIAVLIDGSARPRPVNRVTFYRHLRDIQAVRGS